MALWQNEGPSSSFRHLLKIIKITRLLPLAGSKTKRNTYDLLLIVQDGSVPSFFIIEDCLFLFIPTSEASLRINGIKQTRHEFQSHCVILQMELPDLMFHFSRTWCFACTTVYFSTQQVASWFLYSSCTGLQITARSAALKNFLDPTSGASAECFPAQHSQE